MTNLLLLVCGSIGTASWLRSRSRTGLGAWVGVLSLFGFIAVFLMIVIPENSESLASWLPEKAAAIQQLVAIQAWSFVVAEVHRVVSIALAAVTVAIMLISMMRSPPQERTVPA